MPNNVPLCRRMLRRARRALISLVRASCRARSGTLGCTDDARSGNVHPTLLFVAQTQDHSADLPTTVEGGPTTSSTSAAPSREPRNHFTAKTHKQPTIPMAYMPDITTNHPPVATVYLFLVGTSCGYAGGGNLAAWLALAACPLATWAALASPVATTVVRAAGRVVVATVVEATMVVVVVAVDVVVDGGVVVTANFSDAPPREAHVPVTLASRSKAQRPDAGCTVGGLDSLTSPPTVAASAAQDTHWQVPLSPKSSRTHMDGDRDMVVLTAGMIARLTPK
mmetsp:Transcript_56852/g.124724  ORF Transcript_56852/g.124724 Transcript_56852/m.124724 type:complete len:280 (-) Transcript_56852:280-1119(-)